MTEEGGLRGWVLVLFTWMLLVSPHLSFQQSFRFSTNCIGLLSLQLPILPAFSCVLVVLPTCFIVSFSLLDVSWILLRNYLYNWTQVKEQMELHSRVTTNHILETLGATLGFFPPGNNYKFERRGTFSS